MFPTQVDSNSPVTNIGQQVFDPSAVTPATAVPVQATDNTASGVIDWGTNALSKVLDAWIAKDAAQSNAAITSTQVAQYSRIPGAVVSVPAGQVGASVATGGQMSNLLMPVLLIVAAVVAFKVLAK